MSCNSQAAVAVTQTLYAEAVDVSRTAVIVIVISFIVRIVSISINVTSNRSRRRGRTEVLRRHVTLVRTFVRQNNVDDQSAVVVQSVLDVVDVCEFRQSQLFLELSLRHLDNHQQQQLVVHSVYTYGTGVHTISPRMLILGIGLGLKAKFPGLGLELGLGILWPWP